MTGRRFFGVFASFGSVFSDLPRIPWFGFVVRETTENAEDPEDTERGYLHVLEPM